MSSTKINKKYLLKESVYLRRLFKYCLSLQGYSVNNNSFYLKNLDKKHLQKVNEFTKLEMLNINKEFVKSNIKNCMPYLINSKDIELDKIDPIFIEVKTKEQKDIFKFFDLTYWSLKHSTSPGRQCKFLIYDNYHKALIGLLGFKSPNTILVRRIINHYVDRPSNNRLYTFLNSFFEGFLIGAVPPYNNFLFSKFIASICCSKEILNLIKKKYNMNLIIPFTTGAYLKSAIYNRLKDQKGVLCHFIGYTNGDGTNHIPYFFKKKIYDFIEKIDSKITRNYSCDHGMGPMKNLIRFNKLSGLNYKNITKHYMRRSIYLFNTIQNQKEILKNSNKEAIYIDRSFDEIYSFFKKRWLYKRDTEIYKNMFLKKDFEKNIFESLQKSKKLMEKIDNFV